MTAVLDPGAQTGFHEGRFVVSGEDDGVYLLTSDGAIPLGESALVELADGQISGIGSDWFTYDTGEATTYIAAPVSPAIVGATAFEGAVTGIFHGESESMFIGLGVGISAVQVSPGDPVATIQLSASTIAEDAEIGTVIGALSVVNGSGSYSYSITADPDGKFDIDGANLVTDAALDYETAASHSVTISADNGVDAPISRVFGITVTDVDDTAPTITSGNPSGSYAEGVAISGTLTANEAVTWSKSGTDAGAVTLNTSTGVWSLEATDYETKTSYSWTFTATDAASNTTNQVVAITITDIDEVAPTITSVDPSGSYVEGDPVGGTLTADESVTWSVSGTDAGEVTLNASSGVWSLPETVFATKASYSFTFTATDAAENSSDQVVSIAITEAVATPLTAIAADGWRATYPTPPGSFDPDGDPVTFDVTRAGFDSAGDATTFSDTLTVTTRVREPYPDQANLTADTVALSDYVYADDVISGVTNNSTEVSPKPVAAWLTRHRAVVGNVIGGDVESVEIAAFHRDARGGRQVACVVFSVSDGTTTLTETVTDVTMVPPRLEHLGAVLVYRLPEVDISSLDTGLITVNAKVYPHVGVAASVLDSADKSDSALFSPRYFLKNTTLLTSPPLAYVSTTGNDSTGVVSTNAVTAAASPFATIGGAIIAINAALSATTGLDGAEIRLAAGTHTMGSIPSGFAVQRVAAITITAAPGVDRENAIAAIPSSNLRMRIYGSFTSPITTGAIRFKDVTVQRTGVGCLQGETDGYLDIFHEDVAYDGGSVPNISLFRGNCWWLGCDTINLTSQAMGSQNTGTHALFRGIDFQDDGLGLQAQCIVGCMTWDGSLVNNTNAGANGAVIAFNKCMAITGDFINWRHSADTTEGAAIVQNVFEFTGAAADRLLAYDLAGEARPSGARADSVGAYV